MKSAAAFVCCFFFCKFSFAQPSTNFSLNSQLRRDSNEIKLSKRSSAIQTTQNLYNPISAVDFDAGRENALPLAIDFTVPDTVCVNSLVNIINNSTGGSNFYWSFCETDFSAVPAAVNLGNPGGVLQLPVFMDLAQDENGIYYGFVVNNSPSGITRYNYGNSFLNTPTIDFLGNIGGALPGNAEGIQIKKVNNNWIGVVVGGDTDIGQTSEVGVINFGPALDNPAPVATNWGNVGSMAYPVDLFLFNEGGNWYGYTLNFRSNSITLLNFGTDFSSAPTGINLGNIGGLNNPTGIGEIKDGNNWYLFVVNEGSNSLTRLEFGNSLLNTPSGINIGNPGILFGKPRDISFIKLCDGINALTVNGEVNTITKLNFQNDITGNPVATSFGNIGSLSFPHSISKLFRVDSDIYTFITNVNNNSLTRLRFSGCNSIPGSSLQNPAPITYTQPGTYNINLIMDIGLVTQSSLCKKIVVIDCSVQGISNIINDYTPVVALNPCNNSLTVEDGTAFHLGDTVLLIQMKGAVIDVTNTAGFGSIQDYRNAGNYEFNFVKAATGNIIELKNRLTRQYNINDGKVQLIRVPYYTSPVVTQTLTCLPWDGNKGGVLVLNASDTINLLANIDVSGKGFQGGAGFNSGNPLLTCFENEYNYPATSDALAGLKGETIATLDPTIVRGKGAPASGGGGGLGHNSGGGGGANAGSGGFGGYQLDLCGNFPFDNRGIGGHALTYSTTLNKIFLGAGGGAGNADNPGNINPTGGNGGGIIIFNANYLKSDNHVISANGISGIACTAPPFLDCHDGMAGGGAGGCVLLNVNQFIDNVVVENKGGAGVDMTGPTSSGELGPGGGGGGGILFVKSAALSPLVTVANTGGINGVVTGAGNDPYGATAGTAGLNLFNLVVPVDNVLFTPNIDSVRIRDSATSCSGFNFQGLGYTNTDGIASWQWNFGDNVFANTQNASHAYSGAGNYTVHLIITDTNGCKDSTTTVVTAIPLSVSAGLDTSFCSNNSVVHQLHGNTSGSGYSWSPAALLNNADLQNPVATVPGTTTFYLASSNISGCVIIDSVKITVNPLPVISTITDIGICKNDSIILTTIGNANTYEWAPPLAVNGPSSASPYFIDTVSQQMIVTGTIIATGCFAKDTVNLTVKPIPDINSIPDSAMCGAHNVTLTTTGAQTYSWSPATNLSNSNTASPVFTGTGIQTFTYYVTGTAMNACTAEDTVVITVNAQPAVSTINNISICRGDSILLVTTSDAQNHQWTPALSVNNPAISNPYFHDTVSQQMIVTGTNTTGCFAKDTVNLTVKPIPDINSIPDSAMCGAHNVTLTTTGAQSYSWSPATNLSNPNIASPVFTGTGIQSFTYYVTGTGMNACTAKDTVVITVNALPVVSTINNTSICRNDQLQLLTTSNAQIHSWSPGTAVNNPGLLSPFFIDSISQTMTLTGTNTSTGCYSTASVMINVKPLPVVETIDDFLSCATSTVTLFTTGAQTYSWVPAAGLSNPTIAAPIFTGPGTQIYHVTGTASNGCKASDSVKITIAAKPVFTAPPNKSTCLNTAVQLDGNNGAAFQYIWTPATYLDNPLIINPTALPQETTSYLLTISDEVCNYDSSFTVMVTINALPDVNVSKSNDLDCAKPESRLTATGAANYTWWPGTSLSNTMISNPVASPEVTTQFIVTGTDNAGCSNKDSIVIYVKGGKYNGFRIPNSFTPNADNLNDCFGLPEWGETRNFTFVIYSRWGQKVFETNKVDECWDGNYKGGPAEPGNYVYHVNGETLCGKVNLKGNVLLIR